MNWAIEATNVRKSYKGSFWEPGVQVLKGLSFRVPEGSVFGFLGANGAGKTTTIKMLLDLQRPDSGELRILGKTPGDVKVRTRIGFLPERPYFPEWMRTEQFLNLARDLFPSEISGQTRSNGELLELVDLKDVGNRRLGGFSKGMLQRIGIAQVLVGDPDLIILDEPMSGLDPEGRRDTRDLIIRLNEIGKTIFFSSHILSDVEQICDSFVFLEQGKEKFGGSVSEVLSNSGQTYDLIIRGSFSTSGEILGFKARELKSGDFLLRRVPMERVRGLVEWSYANGGNLLQMHPSQSGLEDMLFPEKKKGDNR